MTLSNMKPIVVEDRDTKVCVVTPNWKSVHAVWETDGFVQDMIAEFDSMSRQARRKFAKKVEKQRKFMKLVDEILNDQQDIMNNGQMLDTDGQREFNSDALKITVWDHFVEGSPMVLAAQPNQELVPTLH